MVIPVERRAQYIRYLRLHYNLSIFYTLGFIRLGVVSVNNKRPEDY